MSMKFRCHSIALVLLFSLSAAGCSKAPEPPAGPQIIDLATFNKLKPGMTYDEVIKVVGNPGSLPGDTKEPPKGVVIAVWPNGDGSNAHLVFSDGKLMTKRQSGLK